MKNGGKNKSVYNFVQCIFKLKNSSFIDVVLHFTLQHYFTILLYLF